MVDITYHYPPDLFQLLIDAIPKLCRTKKNVVEFFTGAGVSRVILGDLTRRVYEDRESISKAEFVQTVLARLNQRGEVALRERREVLKRVVEWEDFSTCWPDDQLTAQGLVAQIQKVVNVKDTFTRINLEREDERKQRLAEAKTKQDELQRRKTQLSAVKRDLFSLFRETNPQKRGKALESVLNRLFAASDILVRDAFTLTGSQGEGVVEQIDGVVEIDRQIYLVEMKWWSNPIGKAEIAQHLVRVYHRAETHGIFISASGYTEGAVADCKDALQQRVIILCTLEEIVHLLDQEKPLKDVFRMKINVAKAEKTPLFDPLSSKLL
jgi:restriction endonuclease Mrr